MQQKVGLPSLRYYSYIWSGSSEITDEFLRKFKEDQTKGTILDMNLCTV